MYIGEFTMYVLEKLIYNMERNHEYIICIFRNIRIGLFSTWYS